VTAARASGRPTAAPSVTDAAPERGTLLGVDLGERRIGLALGDPGSGGAAPLRTLRRADPERDAASLRSVCRDHRVAGVVVGLPLHMDGREGEQARHTRDWVAAIAPLLDVPVTLRDERLSSAGAEARLGRPPRGRSGGPPSGAALRAWRARVDREAAAAIVQAELDARAGRLPE
jgi:putative holliday junction resolvase